MKHTLREKLRKVVAIVHEYSDEIICVTVLSCLMLRALGYFIRSIKM